jgi:hypothetical protein
MVQKWKIKLYWGPVGGWGSARGVSEILMRERVLLGGIAHTPASEQSVGLRLRELFLRKTR